MNGSLRTGTRERLSSEPWPWRRPQRSDAQAFSSPAAAVVHGASGVHLLHVLLVAGTDGRALSTASAAADVAAAEHAGAPH